MFIFLLSLLLAASPLSAESFWQKTTWMTTDGVQLEGLYHASSRPEAYTWVLLHGLGSGKGEWEDFARRLVDQGSGVLVYDARGHGESTHLASGEVIDYKAWQTGGVGSPWEAMPSDLASAVKLLNEKMTVPEKKIAVGGASLGANVALVYASAHASVPALILLSPGMDYAGIEAALPYKTYTKRPVFIAASPSDLYAFSSVRQLTDRVSSPKQVVVAGPGGHGVQMFKDEEFMKKLLEWTKKVEHR